MDQAGLQWINDEVREAVRRAGIDPLRDRAAVARMVDEVIGRYRERAWQSGETPEVGDDIARSALDAVAGFGPLQRFFDDPDIEEIWINEPGRIFIARGGRSELTTTVLSASDVRALVERMLQWSGRRIDLSTPFVDATLPDGSRLHVAIPDITRAHWAVNIRRFVQRPGHIHDLVPTGSLTSAAATFLEAAVVSGLNVIVAGGTQAGKTTLLNGLLGCVP